MLQKGVDTMRIVKFECPQLTQYSSKDKPNCALSCKDGAHQSISIMLHNNSDLLLCIILWDGNYIDHGILY